MNKKNGYANHMLIAQTVSLFALLPHLYETQHPETHQGHYKDEKYVSLLNSLRGEGGRFPFLAHRLNVLPIFSKMLRGGGNVITPK